MIVPCCAYSYLQGTRRDGSQIVRDGQLKNVASGIQAGYQCGIGVWVCDRRLSGSGQLLPAVGCDGSIRIIGGRPIYGYLGNGQIDGLIGPCYGDGWFIRSCGGGLADFGYGKPVEIIIAAADINGDLTT